MRFLHMLLAVALTLRGICAWLELTLEQLRSLRVSVVDVAVSLLLGGPAKLSVSASWFCALPRARVGFLMLGQIAWAFEDLVAEVAFLIDIHWRSILLPASH